MQGLARDPFDVPSLPLKPFLVSDSHRRAYCGLVEAVRGGERVAMLLGRPGMGKTTMLQHLLRGLRFEGIASETYAPRGAVDVSAPAGTSDPAEDWPGLRDRVFQHVAEGHRVVLGIDDADTLPDTLLAQIVDWPQSSGLGAGRLTVLLTATPEGAKRIQARLAASPFNAVELGPMSRVDVAGYVSQVFWAVRGENAGNFEPAAIDALTLHSLGNLGRVNRLCSAALALVADDSRPIVTAEVIGKAARVSDAFGAPQHPHPADTTARADETQPRPTLHADASNRTAGPSPAEGPVAASAHLLQEAGELQSLYRPTPAVVGPLPELTRSRRTSRRTVAYAVGAVLTAGVVGFGWQAEQTTTGHDVASQLELWLAKAGHHLRRPAADASLPPGTATNIEAANTGSRPEAAAPEPVVGPVPAAAAAAVPPLPLASKPSSPVPPAAAPARDPQAEQLIATLILRGDQMLRQSDAVSARLYYQRAVDAGSARALAALAATYDPAALSAEGARGVRPDPGRAAELYLRAARAGDATAETRLRALTVVFGTAGSSRTDASSDAVSQQR
jgi:type II secretory pathway predicted ATPase ExeA